MHVGQLFIFPCVSKALFISLYFLKILFFKLNNFITLTSKSLILSFLSQICYRDNCTHHSDFFHYSCTFSSKISALFFFIVSTSLSRFPIFSFINDIFSSNLLKIHSFSPLTYLYLLTVSTTQQSFLLNTVPGCLDILFTDYISL